MERYLGRPLRQPLIGVVTLSVALIALAASWDHGTAAWQTDLESPTRLILALCSVGAITLAYRFPIYVRHSTKVCICTVPLYLITVFLVPPLAAATAGLGVLAGEMVIRARHANSLSVVATHTGRWVLVVLVGSPLAHAPVPTTDVVLHSVLLVATGIVLFAGDILTVPLALVPIGDERVERIILTCLRQGGLVEAAQYAVGMLGTLVVERQAWALTLLALPMVLLYLLYKKEVDADTYQLLETMADAVDLRDPYTVEHSRRVVELTRSILEELGRNGQEAALILVAARLHDVGKVEVPDHILLKRGPLTVEERAVMEAHPVQGADLLKCYPDFARIVEMVRHHHERWDGTGYPSGLKRADMPFGARIVAVAESFDAMTTDRSYRRALSTDRAAEILRDGRGRQWDPLVVDAFLRSIGGWLEHPMDPVPVLSVPDAADAIGSVVPA
jgi:putative nucleotidyltransferase with HDIG domain